MDDDIDLSELAAQFDGDQLPQDDEELGDAVDQEADEETDDSGDEDQDQQESEDPPGYVSYEEWIKAGKDPDMYRGKKAYKEQYDLIQKNKEMKQLKRELEKLRDEAIECEKIQVSREKKALEKEMAIAREDGDIDAVLDLKDKMDTLNRQEAQHNQPQVHPVISEFVSSQQILEDPDIKREFARIYDGKLRADGVGMNDQLSPAAIKGYLAESMNRIKSLYPDRFKAKSVARTGPPIKTGKPAPVKVDFEKKLSQLSFGDGLNKAAAINMYRQIKNDSGQNAADDFAKQFLGL